MNSADCLASRGRRVRELDDVGHPGLAAEAVVAQRGPLRVETARRVGDTALDRHRQVAAVGRQPVTDHLRRLVGPLEGARDHRPATGAAGSDVLRRHDDRGRSHQHRLAQVLGQTDLARRRRRRRR